jgi:transposase
VFVDEFGTNLGMTRRYARAPRGERAPGSAPNNPDPHITLTMGLRYRGLVAPMTTHGAIDGLGFAAYLRSALGPTLRPGDIVLVDGVGAHRSRAAREAVEARGARYRILPPYSPDLTPVEQAGSKVKGLMRGFDARSVEALLDAAAHTLGRVTAQDARGWFANDGYVPKRRGRAQSTAPPLESVGPTRVARAGYPSSPPPGGAPLSLKGEGLDRWQRQQIH